jgi:hypothetical protein
MHLSNIFVTNVLGIVMLHGLISAFYIVQFTINQQNDGEHLQLLCSKILDLILFPVSHLRFPHRWT